MTTGERIRQLRVSKGLSQEELGRKIGVQRAAINKYETGVVVNLKRSIIAKLAEALDTSPTYLMGWENSQESIPSDAIPFTPSYRAPIVGSIPAGYPAFAFEDIEGYADIPYSDEENYFFLRVNGDSMETKIHTGDLVLIRKQTCANDGQIVAARVNGDEATLKRYKRQGDTVLLLPENPAYEPYIIPVSDFDTGYASIIGVALEVRHSL